jgi:hypothetical protein
MATGVTVIEYQQFKQRAPRFLSDPEILSLIDYLSDNPKAGVEFAGTGGIRHLKWPQSGEKSSNKCIVGYYFSSAKMPLHLLNAYKIGEKNLLEKLIGVAFECL